MPRDEILGRVRSALGIHAVQSPPPVRLTIAEIPGQSRIDRMLERVAALAGKTLQASPAGALAYVAETMGGKPAVASNAPFLRDCGIAELPNVRSGIEGRAELRELCGTCAFGITSADYALADTGTLVMLSSPQEARMISLLPPAHIAVVPAHKILSGLDELLTLLPRPSEQTSSMVLITGPSRTGDIEQILVRGVHGPGEIHVIVVDE
ncbi:MAG: lactate utilization protein [Acidobacteriota bacterium]|nr:lactate utilization protein [Acidobacteriota bacterium]